MGRVSIVAGPACGVCGACTRGLWGLHGACARQSGFAALKIPATAKLISEIKLKML